MNTRSEVEGQQELADRLAEIAARGWSRVFVNCEMEMTSAGVVLNWVAFSVTRSLFGKLTRVDMRLDGESFGLFSSLGAAMMQRARVSRLTVDALIQREGKFRFFVDYDAPARLSGDILKSDRYLRYIKEDAVLFQFASLEGKGPSRGPS